MTAFVSFAADVIAENLNKIHKLPVKYIKSVPLSLLCWIAFSCVLVWVVYMITMMWVPSAAGSGIPEVKVILSGNDMPQYLTFKTLVGKVLGLALVIGAGLFAGKQGPMVHIGAIIAILLTKLPPFKCSFILLYLFSKFYLIPFIVLYVSPELRSQVLTAGTSCGISSHFGTPIAGMLFTVEITPSYYATRNYWFSGLSSIIASFLMRVLYNLYEKYIFHPINVIILFKKKNSDNNREGISLFTPILYYITFGEPNT